MKICYLGDAPSPHVKKFVDYFAKTGNEIYVISVRKARFINAKFYQIPHITPFEDVDYLLSLPWLKKIIKSINPDILHAHYLTSFGLLGALVNYHPFIVTAWGTDLLITPKKGCIYRRLLRFTLKKANLVFADANFMKEELLRYGASAGKILICPFGVDMKIFNNESKEIRETGEPRILCMRTLIQNSNIDVILKSMKILKDKHINFILNITNRGVDEEKLQRMVSDLGLESSVNFLGFVKRKEIYRYFRDSDLYLSIPTSDGTSVTLLEAMASGLFPIVSDIPANREWIEDGINGFIVPPKDPDALANKIILAVRQTDFRRKTARMNRELVRRKGELVNTMEFVSTQYELLSNIKKHPHLTPIGS